MYPAVLLSGHLGLWIFWGLFEGEGVAIIVDAVARLYRGYGALGGNFIGGALS